MGKYNVYYIDEANVALFANSKWVVPLLDYYPKEYDFADFDPGRQKVATYEGKVYFAPLTGGGDLHGLSQGPSGEGRNSACRRRSTR